MKAVGFAIALSLGGCVSGWQAAETARAGACVAAAQSIEAREESGEISTDEALTRVQVLRDVCSAISTAIVAQTKGDE